MIILRRLASTADSGGLVSSIEFLHSEGAHALYRVLAAILTIMVMVMPAGRSRP